MSFTPEDGTGLAGSNAYISEAYADTYHADRGRSDWSSAVQADKETAIVRATDYIDKRFGTRFRGERHNKTQALEWPRLNAMDNDGFMLNDVDDLPRQLEKATAEYALIALRIGELAPRPNLPSRQESIDGTETSSEGQTGAVKSKSEKVGPIEERTEYVTSGSGSGSNTSLKSALVNDNSIPEYPSADLLITELLRSRVSRKVGRS